MPPRTAPFPMPEPPAPAIPAHRLEDLARRLDEPLERLRRAIVAGAAGAVLAIIDDVARSTGADVRRALDRTEAAVELADGAGCPLTRARARRARARALAFAGRFGEALRAGLEAVEIAVGADEPVEAARARLAIMHPLSELGRLEEAIGLGETARRAFLEAGAPDLAARADINLGITHRRRDAPEDAIRCFERSRPLLEDDPVLRGSLENSLGEALVATSDFAGAEAAFERARTAFEAAGQPLNVAIAEGNLGDLAHRHGRPHEALRHFDRAQAGFAGDDLAVHRARLQAEEAEVRAGIGLLDAAVELSIEAMEVLDRHGLALESARAREHLGRTLLGLGRLAEADNALQAAERGYAGLDHVSARARTQLVRASLALARDRLDDAHALAAEAMGRLVHRPADAAGARLLLADVHLRARRLELADAEIDAGLSLARELDLAPLLAQLEHLRGRLRRAQGRLDEAIEALQRAVGHVERVRGLLQADRWRSSFLGRWLEVHETLLEVLLERRGPGDDALILDAVELARSRSLLELVRGVDEPSDGASGDEAGPWGRLQRVRSELNARYSLLADAREQGEGDARSWARAIHRGEAELAALEERLALQGGGLLVARPVELDRLRSMLGEAETVLELAVVAGELAAIVIRRDGVDVVRGLATVASIDEAVGRLGFQIDRVLWSAERRDDGGAGRRVAAAHRSLRELHELVLGPLATSLPDDGRLHVVPHGALHRVPFAALHDGRSHLIERMEVGVVPSAGILAGLRERPEAPATAAPLVVGVADDRAPAIEQEARSIAAALERHEARLLAGEDATVEAVTRHVAGAEIVHLACHGRFDPAAPERSGLRLAGGWLSARAIAGLDLRACRLAVLSACESGRAGLERGDELTGLVRSVLAAGASSALLSLWRVGDESTTDLMIDLHGRLLAGASPAAALRAAQCAEMRRRPHPAAWAAFQLIGA